MNKLVRSIREAVSLSGVKDGMTVSFHHHLRNGDFVLIWLCGRLPTQASKALT